MDRQLWGIRFLNQLQWWAGFAVFVCVGALGHLDMVPVALQPYKQYIETLGWLGALYTTYRLQPPRQPWKG